MQRAWELQHRLLASDGAGLRTETQVVHIALSILAEETLPAYEPDDGPLTARQMASLRSAAKAGMPKGKVLDKQSLF